MKFLQKMFSARSKSSAGQARERLISVLIHDRTDISPQLLENLRIEMISLLKKYMEIDESNIEINLDHGNRSAALIANVPVLRVKRRVIEQLDNGDNSDSDNNNDNKNNENEKNKNEINEKNENKAASSRNFNKNKHHR